MLPIDEVAPRLSGGILLLVTVSLLRARLSNDLPNIGYLVAIDYIFFAIQIIMWIGIGISGTSYWFKTRGNAIIAHRINIAGAIFYPLPILGVGTFLWLTI